MRNKIVTTDQVKQMDLIQILQELGYSPNKIVRQDYWYLSPFRTEKTASFKINRTKNAWYDFGEGVGGNVLDFIIKYYHCSVKEALEKFSTGTISNTLQPILTERQEDKTDTKIEIFETKTIQHPALLHYLDSRRIPLNIAQKYCREVDFAINSKSYFAIGFTNNLGGYELRNAYFKGSSSPKSVTHLDNQSDKIYVFEGFFNFLSWLSIHQTTSLPASNFLILNSLGFLEKQRNLMENHREIHLYLDHDNAGIKATEAALNWSPKYQDAGSLYSNYKDLNHWLQHIGKTMSISQRHPR